MSSVLSRVTSIACSAMLLFACSGVYADQPLTQEGKRTVYQRVISHPSAVLYEAADTKSPTLSKPRVFTSFYVYERKGDMLKVGTSSTKADGWVEASKITEWPQAITMVFTDQMGRDPVLFFKDHDSIQKACESDSIADYLSQFVQLINSGSRLPDNSPVIAIEPTGESGQVAKQAFYLLPILNVDTQYKEAGTQLLEVASINPNIDASTFEAANKGNGSKPDGKTDQSSDQRMKTGIVFVIDTTISMKSYIDQTMKIVRKIYDELSKSKSKDGVELAIVAFRSNLEKSPSLGYTTKIVSDFKPLKERKDLEKSLSKVEEAKVSSHAFDEDSFAGVKDAVDKLSWNRVNSKVMLLITDAGPLGAGDKTSQTGMSPEALADYLRANKIYLTTVHIKAPNGKKDHKYAEDNYTKLSMMSNGKASYIPIDAPNSKKGAETFDKVGDQMATVYRQVVEASDNNTELKKPEVKEISKNVPPEELAKRIAEATGYAMRLQFLGDKKETKAPQVVKAWIADADLAELEKNPDDAPTPSVYPAVLLTKTQLSQLRKQLKLIIDTAEEAFLQDNKDFNFYEQLMSAAAQMSRDPDAFNRDPKANLAQKGVLLEVLDGLPYKSRVLGLQKEDWVNMSTGEQQEFIKRLKGLIARYDEYDKDNSHWEGFGSKNTNEWVYRVPLNMLP